MNKYETINKFRELWQEEYLPETLYEVLTEYCSEETLADVVNGWLDFKNYVEELRLANSTPLDLVRKYIDPN